MNDRNYVIVEAKYLEYVNFSQVLETNPDTVRYSLDKKKFMLKYIGEQPDFIFQITKDAIGLQEYNKNKSLAMFTNLTAKQKDELTSDQLLELLMGQK